LAIHAIAIKEYWHILKKRKLLVFSSGVIAGLLGAAFFHLYAMFPSILIHMPKALTAGIAGLMAGIVFGLILILVVESFESSSGAIEAVEEAIGSRVTGVIPTADAGDIISVLKARFPNRTSRVPLSIIDLATHYAPGAPISEGFRVLRTNTLSGERDKATKVIAVTSASPGEGRTLTSVNLAISLAQSGLKTLLVEADLRRPAFARIFGIEEQTGLTDIVLGNFPWRDTIKGVTDIIMGKMTMDDVMLTPGLDNLGIITSGGRPVNPAEMIGSRGFADFLNEAKQEYDFIILDSPPVLAAADAAIVGEKADAVFMVFRIGTVSRNLLKRAVVRLEQARCGLAGVILNCTKPDIETAYQEESQFNHKGILSAVFKKRKTVEGEQTDEQVKKASVYLWGGIILVAVALIAAAAMYMVSTHRIEKKPEIVKSAGPVKTQTESVKPKESASAVKEPVTTKPQQPQQPEQKISIQSPPVKTEVTQKNVSAVEGVNQPGAYPFSIYLGSFKTSKKAEETVSLNREQGIDGFWVKVNNEDIGTWYRIYAGWFKNRAQAESFINEHDFEEAEIKETAYANLIGNFKNIDELRVKVQSLKDRGYSSYSIKGFDGTYKLYAGAFMTEAGAEEQGRELKADGLESSVIRR